ncbi:hypothetical protein EVAR_17050_1 [Eumeta japonica]|uniref:Uncharacterized protein n=1 Tax=Eumeta variegata TaxID=151549 RepID=A0A4C1V4I2_EUMVA|nr:hypothetical protein EVAR_17050_1 [Eumeta japonica]
MGDTWNRLEEANTQHRLDAIQGSEEPKMEPARGVIEGGTTIYIESETTGRKRERNWYQISSGVGVGRILSEDYDVSDRDCLPLLANGPDVRSRRNPGPFDTAEYSSGEARIC